MSDLAEYFSDKDRIKELELQVKTLENDLKREIKLKSKWKCKYLKDNPVYNQQKLARSHKAVAMIISNNQKGRIMKLKKIAKDCFLSHIYVGYLSACVTSDNLPKYLTVKAA